MSRIYALGTSSLSSMKYSRIFSVCKTQPILLTTLAINPMESNTSCIFLANWPSVYVDRRVATGSRGCMAKTYPSFPLSWAM
jgi:hypothetical protein